MSLPTINRLGVFVTTSDKYPVSDIDIQDILEVIDRRHKTASTIICSQFDVPDWHGKLRTPTIADAICDRLAHDSYKIVIKGVDSMHKQNAKQPKK